MFVSNSDNLGATMDLKLLTWFADSKAPFAMEVGTRALSLSYPPPPRAQTTSQCFRSPSAESRPSPPPSHSTPEPKLRPCLMPQVAARTDADKKGGPLA
jgi:hypothetical protein